MSDADTLWEAIHRDPAGTYGALGAELAAAGYAVDDPRLAEMYADWQQRRELEQYDATVAQIVSDPANADIDPNRYHTFVAAADGDFQKALDMYRADVARVLQTYGPAQPATGGYVPDPNARPQDSLHRAIEEAARAARRPR